MKKFLFALSMLAFVVSALPQARGADVSIDFIYDNLSGGNWIEAEGYGYGWQPDLAVSDPNWRPYADGYWAYTDYGWTWISYEDFGWATYHYGRWANLADYGWTWFPGSDLDWGPAWTSNSISARTITTSVIFALSANPSCGTASFRQRKILPTSRTR